LTHSATSRSRLPALVAISCAGFAPLLFLPLIVSVPISQFGVSEAVGGRVGSLELFAIAAVSIALIPFIGHLDRRRLAAGGLMLMIVCTLLPMWSSSFEVYRWMRAGSGIGEGAVLAAVHASVARLRDPDRAFALCNFALVTCGVLLYPAVAAEIPHYGVRALLVAILAMAVIGLIAVRWFGDRVDPSGSVRDPGARSRIPELVRIFRPAWLALAGIGIFYVAEGALWGYLYRIGLATGMTDAAVGQVISGAFVLSIAATLVAYWLGNRWGRMAPLCLSGALLCGVALVLGNAPTPLTYRIICYVFYFVFVFVVNYSSALLASLDVRGRIAAATPALRMLGTAIGPGLASFLLAGRGFSGVGWLACCFYAAATVLFFLNGRSGISSPAPPTSAGAPDSTQAQHRPSPQGPRQPT
jgi:predicted MFS family arabinose efflux permease